MVEELLIQLSVKSVERVQLTFLGIRKWRKPQSMGSKAIAFSFSNLTETD